MPVLYNSVHFTLLILLLRVKVDDQISSACLDFATFNTLVLTNTFIQNNDDGKRHNQTGYILVMNDGVEAETRKSQASFKII